MRSLGLRMPTLSPQFVFAGPDLRFLLLCSGFAFALLSAVVAVAVAVAVVVLVMVVASWDYGPGQDISDKL